MLALAQELSRETTDRITGMRKEEIVEAGRRRIQTTPALTLTTMIRSMAAQSSRGVYRDKNLTVACVNLSLRVLGLSASFAHRVFP
ncbi:hypothetical protein LJR034_005551 [Caballeronia sp. LjRoot34]|uniref:hypothetical protein n=1 Tax=Caballeronia sp. LjRoot34 TaxID=3342325 RepID=UPI003ECC9D0E